MNDAGFTDQGWLADLVRTRTRELAQALDQSEQHRRALQASEHKLQLLIKYAPMAVAMLDRDMRYMAHSDRWLSDYGLNEKSLVGRSHYEVFPEIPERWKQVHRRCLQGATETSDDDSFVRSDGRREYLRWTIHPWRDADGRIGGLVVLSEVITARKEAELELARSRETLAVLNRRLSQAQRIARMGYFMCDLADGTVEWSAELYRVFGVTRDHIPHSLEDCVSQFVHPDDREMVTAKMGEIETGNSGAFDFRIVQPVSHEPRVLHLECEAIMGADGKLERIFGTVQDITEQQQREERLRASESTMRILVQHAPEAILIYDVDAHRFVEANPLAERLMGLTREQILNIDPLTTVEPKLPEGILLTDAAPAIIRRVLRGATETQRLIVRHTSGEKIETEVRLVRLPSADRRLIRGSLIDIRERRSLEEQLRQAQKMDAMGKLAGGVAHDFNNLLTAIKGFAGYAAEAVRDRPETLRDLQEVLKAAEKAERLTSQLLTFSRRQSISPRVLVINAVVEDMGKMLRRLLGEDIAYETQLAPDLWPTRIDEGALSQVLVNLAVNARDAMPQGGRLLIRTHNQAVEAPTSTWPVASSTGDWVVLEVRDWGTGMPPEVAERVFEPFFTTKERGKGTGLGLPTCYGIVRQAGGHIEVHSHPGEGTKVRIFLPRTTAVPETRSSPPPRLVPTGSETVLVVEDDPQVRQLAVRVLERGGYQVLQAGDGEEALGYFGASGPKIDLVLTDVLMPRMGGKQLADRLRHERPELPVLFMSGHAQQLIASHGGLGEHETLLAKPFTPMELLNKVREQLSSKPQG